MDENIHSFKAPVSPGQHIWGIYKLAPLPDQEFSHAYAYGDLFALHTHQSTQRHAEGSLGR